MTGDTDITGSAFTRWIGNEPAPHPLDCLEEGNVLVVRFAVPPSLAAQVLHDALDSPRESLGDDGYFERISDSSLRLCRVERLTDHVPSARELASSASERLDALGLPAFRLLKDKLNIKWPGGAGYRCHQDVQAYGEFGSPVAVGIALSNCTQMGGCLWVAPGVSRALEVDELGCVTGEEASRLAFEPVELGVGDAVLFSGTVPHFSETNHDDNIRAMALLSYVPVTEANEHVRTEYYRWRSMRLSTSIQLSTISDFQGELEH